MSDEEMITCSWVIFTGDGITGGINEPQGSEHGEACSLLLQMRQEIIYKTICLFLH